jgi:hypothetical protein
MNPFDAEPLIIARIQARVPGLKTVASASILAGAQDIAPYCPAAFVLADAGAYGPAPSDARVQVESQRWQVVVCVANIRDPADVNTTAQQAGAYLGPVMAALIGWRADTQHVPFSIAERPAPYYEPGYGEFPIIIETRVVFAGTN